MTFTPYDTDTTERVSASADAALTDSVVCLVRPRPTQTFRTTTWHSTRATSW